VTTVGSAGTFGPIGVGDGGAAFLGTNDAVFDNILIIGNTASTSNNNVDGTFGT
jgi:hypothetical protein